jgi:hypothetical protein
LWDAEERTTPPNISPRPLGALRAMRRRAERVAGLEVVGWRCGDVWVREGAAREGARTRVGCGAA